MLMGVELAAVALEEVKQRYGEEQAKSQKRNWRENEGSRAESKVLVGKTGRVLSEVGGDGFGDGSAETVTKAERVKAADGEKIEI